jgi:thiol-disulfide isomerase/thioredoxin
MKQKNRTKNQLKKLLALTFLLLKASLIFAQEKILIKVPIKSIIGIQNLYSRNTTRLKPRINQLFDYKTNNLVYDQVAIAFYPFQYNQYLFERYKINRKNGQEFLEKLNNDKVDTLLLSQKKVNCYVGVFVGLTKNKKCIIVDANNNHDFTDDTVIEYDTTTVSRDYSKDSISLAPTHAVKYEIYKNNTIYSNVGYIKLLPYHSSYSYPDKIEAQMSVYVVPYQHKEGFFSFLGTEYKAIISPGYSKLDVTLDTYKVNIELKDKVYQSQNFVKTNSLLNVDKHYFQPLNFNEKGDTLFIKYWGFKENPTGWQVGNLLPEMESKDTLQKNVQLNNLWNGNNKKYLLLDFWGSWCRPCIESIPELKSFYQENNKKIDLISVDMEYNDEAFIKAKKIINDKKMKWTHLMEKNNQEKGIITSLNIQSYPTMILVNPEGIIIAKEIGLGGISRINETYKKYLSSIK